MKSVVLDSSVYISSLNPQDIFHNKTKKFISNLEKENPDVEIIVPVLIILEVANILKKPADEVMPIFTGGEIVEFDLTLVEKIIPLFKSLELKTSDSIIVAVAKVYEAEFVSWDKKLIKEAKKLLKAHTPADHL